MRRPEYFARKPKLIIKLLIPILVFLFVYIFISGLLDNELPTSLLSMFVVAIFIWYFSMQQVSYIKVSESGVGVGFRLTALLSYDNFYTLRKTGWPRYVAYAFTFGNIQKIEKYNHIEEGTLFQQKSHLSSGDFTKITFKKPLTYVGMFKDSPIKYVYLPIKDHDKFVTSVGGFS